MKQTALYNQRRKRLSKALLGSIAPKRLQVSVTKACDPVKFDQELLVYEVTPESPCSPGAKWMH